MTKMSINFTQNEALPHSEDTDVTGTDSPKITETIVIPPRQQPGKVGLYDPINEHESCGVGFVANLTGKQDHQILQDADIIAINMTHRGACGCEENTGDGAGILTALPNKFLRKVAKTDLDLELGEDGSFAAGIVFFPQDEPRYRQCHNVISDIANTLNQPILGWREMPTNATGANIGPTAKAAQPHMEMLFIGKRDDQSAEDFERALYVLRKQATHQIFADDNINRNDLFYVNSLSQYTIVYKGMLMPSQVIPFFRDLQDIDFETHFAVVHSRFSTNTFPSWNRAHPNRVMAHNGEINTLRGNKNNMRAREGMANSDVFGVDTNSLFPVCEDHLSDSGNFDNVLEFLVMGGYPIQQAIMMMMPEAWENDANMSEEKRAFYAYHANKMEAWDGPADVVFTDGKVLGATLDRNGLRPSRYYVTHDDRVIMASEVGVLEVPPEMVKYKGRLQPGKMFLLDFAKGEIVADETLKRHYASQAPYGTWLKDHNIALGELPKGTPAGFLKGQELQSAMRAFGYTTETMQFMLLPLINELRDPVYSMGNDSALAVLSDKPRMLYDYFKQLFAQVTNPPVDAIREELILSLETSIGPERNILGETPEHAHRLRLPHPILSNTELDSLRSINGYRGWTSATIDITFARSGGPERLEIALNRICQQADEAIANGNELIILSDRAASQDRVAIPSLLATGCVHHHLIRQQKRTAVGLILETGEAREVHHHCLLVGYGIDAINPYIALDSLRVAASEGLIDEKYTEGKAIVEAYKKGVKKGMLKVMGKIGISTLQSYKGAQIFEIVGLGDEVVERCFKDTASRIKGVDLKTIAEETLRRHALGYPEGNIGSQGHIQALPNPGDVHWRSDGDKHMWNPNTISQLQNAARNNSVEAYEQFAKTANDDARTRCTLRGLLKFKPSNAISIDDVEPAAEIVKRFCTGAMSFGSISPEAHETLAIAMNRMGGKSNTGEGGEDIGRFTPEANGDSKRSAIKQIASGRFGVTINYLTNADELQIKIAQGAKPGEGGELPGHKVDNTIARLRHSTPGVGLISPPPHHDIYSIEDLAQLIYDLKNANPSARISVKLVSEVGVGTIATGVVKGHAEHVVVAGHDGGTGASPLTSIKHAGLPWELGVAETHQTLVLNDLRSRTVLQTDGQLKTGRDIVIAALLGAEEFGFATAPLVTLGCIMMRKCHLNTCPVGIATQDPVLREKFNGAPEYIVNYLFMIAEDARKIMAELGMRNINQLIGRVDLLETNDAIQHWKADGLDLSGLLTPAQKPYESAQVYRTKDQNHGLEAVLDRQLIAEAHFSLENKDPTSMKHNVVNTDRAVGTMLSHEIAKRYGEDGLPNNTIQIKLRGSAGQSLGAFLAKGVSINLIGDANDYVGKGLSGGVISVRPHRTSTFVAEENIIAGNTCLYGATTGEVYLRGIAAERFAVRNSGATAVVEGVGDHGCEYMTGGRVVVLGETGRNFAAGMSGGIAYIWNPNNTFNSHCNTEMVDLDPLDSADLEELKGYISKHQLLTESAVAERLLADWDNAAQQFIKVMPVDYKHALQSKQADVA
jgi:glutamate synthase (NADPH/NADH) large chain